MPAHESRSAQQAATGAALNETNAREKGDLALFQPVAELGVEGLERRNQLPHLLLELFAHGVEHLKHSASGQHPLPCTLVGPNHRLIRMLTWPASFWPTANINPLRDLMTSAVANWTFAQARNNSRQLLSTLALP